jgi:DNA-binding NtrC family response regulator
VKGAFSGADSTRPGLVREAEGGSLFLDEIGDASPALQVALLRLVEQREYRAVGSDELRKTDARFIAATHVPLESAVEAGRFRRDLHARLNRIVLRVPPLRDRREDIVPLALHAAQAIAERQVEIDRALALAMLGYDWPGNVRELQAVLDQAIADQPDAERLVLSPALAERLAARIPELPTPVTKGEPQKPTGRELEARLIALGGNMKALADELGVARNTLYRWFSEASLDPAALRKHKNRGPS